MFLVIDLSTTACKSFLIDREGRIRAGSRVEIGLIHPRPGWAEADPREWWAACLKSVREALQKGDVRPGDVECIGVSGLMHVLVPVDKRCEPLYNAILWMDPRCYLQLKWLAENRPKVVEKAHKFLFGKDFIRAKLTGEFATDPSDAAGTIWFDLEGLRWDERKLASIGVPPEKLPEIRRSTSIAGRLTREAAGEIGLREGIPVAVGGCDVHCTLLGADIYRGRRCCLYMGTAAWLARPDPNPKFQVHRASLWGKGVRWVGSTATLGACLRWCRELLGGEGSFYDRFNELASQAPPGSEGLIFLPHMMGERGPRRNPDAKGAFVGLTLFHRLPHLARSIMEGNAYLIRHIIDEHGYGSFDELVPVGGGAKSRLWLRIISDVTGKPILIQNEPEATALGCAILAAVSIGLFKSVEEGMSNWVDTVDRIDPSPENREVYERIYRIYREIDASLEKFYPRLGANTKG